MPVFIPKLPIMRISANIWRNANPTVNPPDIANTSCALWLSDKGMIIIDGNQQFLPLLVVTRRLDVRGNDATAGAGDTVEVPAGSTIFYRVLSVNDQWRGLSNEYRVALLKQIAPFPLPMP